ncbi:MAG TPA: ATP-binding protein [Solirubrobacteraceae bacterium]|nr:ATP-binding protein [Solirubrobacteraceae bacterium]
MTGHPPRSSAPDPDTELRGETKPAESPGAAESRDWGELQHRLLFERNPHPMMVFERGSLRILAVSDAAARAYGYSREEFTSMTVRDLIPVDEMEEFDELQRSLAPVEELGVVEMIQRRHLRKDGSEIEVEITSDNLELGGRQCRLLVLQDVTERERVADELAQARERQRASEERYRTIFERNPQPMVLYDRETLQIVAVSEAMVEHYGYTREEFASMTIKDLLRTEDVARLLAFIAAHPDGTRPSDGLSETEGEGYPSNHRLKDGTIIDVEITSTNLDLDGRPCRIALMNDVTLRNRIAAEAMVARDQAVEASNAKSAFLANVSHEVRTPMNGVIGMTELLLETDLTEEQREYAVHVARSGEQMLSVINDILDLSKIESGHLELELEEFDLGAAVRQTCDSASTLAATKGLTLEIAVDEGVPPRLRGDARRLQQVLLNLLTNAVKFTATGSISVRVEATARSEAKTAISIAVTDSGIGIAADALDRVFDPFTQADASTTRVYGGTGLGLAIVRELVELMDGSITAASEPGRGSTFRFDVEMDNVAAADAAPAGKAEEESATFESAPSVLIAEDNPVNQIVAERMLERCGCTAQVVSDGLAAVEAWRTGRYDLVLMDCQMPHLDGYEATAQIRRLEGANRTPIIAMTAHALAGDRQRCLDAGMDDYLSKPLRHADLRAAITRWAVDRLARADSVQASPVQ